jgi:hypothetical protein
MSARNRRPDNEGLNTRNRSFTHKKRCDTVDDAAGEIQNTSNEIGRDENHDV